MGIVGWSSSHLFSSNEGIMVEDVKTKDKSDKQVLGRKYVFSLIL